MALYNALPSSQSDLLSLIKHKPFIPFILCIVGHLACVLYVYEVATHWAK